MRRNYGYDSYRGRSGLRNVLTVLVVILVVILLLAVAVFFLAQRYMVYGDDGQAHFDFPFLRQEELDVPDPAVTRDVVILTPEPQQTPEPTVAPGRELRAVWLLRGALTDGTAQAQVEAAGGNAVVFNMKADDGTLGYVSSLPQAIALGASDAKPELNRAIQALTGGELYTIARVSCFKDNKAPRGDNSLAIKTNSGYNWQDPEGIRWMNVTVPAAREYVIGVCRELAELGFDEILLENSGYPTQGHLEYIKKGEAYDPDALSAPVEAFYTQLAQAMEDYPQVRLSVMAEAPLLSDDRSGQTSAMLGSCFDGIYAPAPEKASDYAGFLGELKEAGFEGEVVYVLPAGETVVSKEGSSLVKPWETPAPGATPSPSQTPRPSPGTEG